MLNPELEKYLQECKSKNITFDLIEKSLLTSKYPTEIIDQARNWYNQPSTPLFVLPIQNTTPIQTVYTNNEQQLKEPSLRPKLFIIFLLLLLPVFLIASFYAIATEKIKLPYPEIQQRISAVYYSLPIVPKTPEMVIAQAIVAHQKILKNSFDLSLSMSGLPSETSSLLGSSNNIDLSFKGFVDYSQSKNPKFNLSFFLGKDLNIEVRKKDANVYIQVPKIPPTLYLTFGLEPEKFKPLLANWVSFDTTPLETEASKKIDEIKLQEKTKSQKTGEDNFSKLFKEKVLPLLRMTSEELEGKPVYKIRFKPTAGELDSLVEGIKEASNTKAITAPELSLKTGYKLPKTSEYIKNLEVLIYIGRKDSYIYRSDVSLSLDYSSLYSSPVGMTPVPVISGPTSPVAIVGVLKLSDFGVDVPIDTPSQSLTQEEFYQKFLELQPGGLLGNLLSMPATPSAK